MAGQVSSDGHEPLERLDALATEAEAALSGAATAADLEQARVRYLGRKAELPQLLRSIPTLPPEQRGELGRRGNELRARLERLVEERASELEAAALERSLAEDRVDVTLP